MPVPFIRARTKAALAALKAKGQRAGEVPYGFRADVDGRLHEDEGEQAVIAAVRQLRADGVSLRRVVTTLESRGFVSRAGKPLCLTSVAKIARAAA